MNIERPVPTRLAYMTSLREIFGPGGGEFVGHDVTCPETGKHLGYREGNLEYLLRCIHENRDHMRELLEVALVIFDDTPAQTKSMGLDSTRPYQPGNWPWPHDLPVADGKRVHDVTVRIPMYSDAWRRARREGWQQGAQFIRARNEDILATLLKEYRTDLLLTDSLTYIFQSDMAVLQKYQGRIVNFHPALLQGEHAIPGLYPTASAIRRFHHGEIFGEGKRVIPMPHLKGYRRHGATLHLTTADIDAGPVIFDREDVEVQDDDTQQTLRHRVFQTGKETLRLGLIKFLTKEAVHHSLSL